MMNSQAAMPPRYQAPSPGGTYEVRADEWQPRTSLWVLTPSVVNPQTGEVALALKDPNWSPGAAQWESDTELRLELRKYPGNHAPASPDIRAVRRIVGAVLGAVR